MNKIHTLSILSIFLLIGCSDDDKPLAANLNRNPEVFSIAVSSVTTSTALLQWEVASDPDNDPVTYTVTLGGTELDNNISDTEYSLSGLLSGTAYTGNVKASDNQGGSTSVQFSFSTQEISTEDSGEVLWQRSYGGSNDDQAYSISVVPDGGFIVAGSSESMDGDITNPIGNTDAWVLKLDEEGNLQWQTSIGGSGQDTIHEISPTSDGGFIVGAFSTSTNNDVAINHGMRDFWVVKLSSSGSIEWSSSLGGSSDDILESIIQTSDGNYIAVGFTNSDELSSGKADAWVVKLDALGVPIWNIALGDSENDIAFSVVETSDFGFALIGYTTTASNKRDAWLVKINQEGEFEWEKTYGGVENDELLTIQQTSDNGFILGGYSRSEIAGNQQNGSSDAWIIKTNSVGDVLWQKTYGDVELDGLSDLIEIPDEAFVFIGSSRMPDGFSGETNGSSDILVLKTDLSGNLIWQRSLGDIGDDYGMSVTITPNSDVVVAGSLYTNIIDQGEGSTGDHNFWVSKLKN